MPAVPDWLNSIILRGDVEAYLHVHVIINSYVIVTWAVQKFYNLNFYLKLLPMMINS